MKSRDEDELNGEYRDVVLLAEILRGRCQRRAGDSISDELADSLEAEETALRILGLGNAVCHQDRRSRLRQT